MSEESGGSKMVEEWIKQVMDLGVESERSAQTR